MSEAKTIVYNDSKPVIECQLNHVYNSEYTKSDCSKSLLSQSLLFIPIKN